MVGTWILRWMTFGIVAFIVSRIIRTIILCDMFKAKGKAKEMVENDKILNGSNYLAFGGGFAQFIIVLMIEFLIWPLSTVMAIYTALQLRDEYLK